MPLAGSESHRMLELFHARHPLIVLENSTEIRIAQGENAEGIRYLELHDKHQVDCASIWGVRVPYDADCAYCYPVLVRR